MPKAVSRACFRRRRALEEGVVGRVGAGPAALDIVDAEPVELAGDRRLVGGPEIDALRLRPVAQRRVVEIDAVAGHRVVLVVVAERHQEKLRGSIVRASRRAVPALLSMRSREIFCMFSNDYRRNLKYSSA